VPQTANAGQPANALFFLLHNSFSTAKDVRALSMRLIEKTQHLCRLRYGDSMPKSSDHGSEGAHFHPIYASICGFAFNFLDSASAF